MTPQLPSISKSGSNTLDRLLHERVALNETPAVFWLATNAKEEIYSNQAGLRVFGDESSGQVHADTTLELYSQTKLVTSIAALQLVDRGLVSVDSEADVAKFLPEMQELEVLTGYGEDGAAQFVKPKNKVTLRMLMSHSVGCAYPFLPSPLTQHFKMNPNIGTMHPNSTLKTISSPLVFEPGTSWLYSVATDFVGKLVERVSGQRLDEYFQKNIFDPLGLTTLTFFPNEAIKKEKMAVCIRVRGGAVMAIPGGFGAGRADSADSVSTELLSGGAGLFGTLREYLVVLRAILQSDPSSPHRSSNPLISPQSFQELFTGCISTESGKKGLVEMMTLEEYIDPPPNPSNIDFSVGLLLNLEDSPGKRKKGSGAWYGAAHTHFWIDPQTGIAGICGTQLLAFPPDIWYKTYVEYETALYAHLE